MTKETLTLIQGVSKIELPLEHGNWVLARDEGYSPIQMLVSAVAACGGYVYQSVLENSNVPFTFHKIEVDFERDATRKSEPIKQIDLRFYLSVDPEYHDKTKRCLKLVAPNCPVIQSIDPMISVEESVIFIR